MRRAFLLPLLLSLGCRVAVAQSEWLFDDVASAGRYEIADDDRAVEASVDATFFFKNNEYFAPQVEGYTLVGYALRPTVGWRLVPGLTLTGGLQALRYGGTSRARYVRPHFAALWRVAPWLALQMGSLPGAASHPFHEAVQDPEEQITDHPETGIQLWLSRPALRGSLWLNWRQFIFRGDTIPERFTAGASMLFGPQGGRVSFEMPFGLIFNHIGGQISDYPDTMQSTANVAVSPSLVLTAGGGFVSAVTFSLHLLAFHAMAGGEVRPFSDGYAFSPEVRLSAECLRAQLAWFHARDFYAPQGNPLFSSVSNYDAAYYGRDRDLLVFGASFVRPLGLVGRFALDFKGYFDVPGARFDYSYGLTMVLTPGTRRLGS